ncbi:hypothetical protein ACFX2F_016903 [Malus domestica]
MLVMMKMLCAQFCTLWCFYGTTCEEERERALNFGKSSEDFPIAVLCSERKRKQRGERRAIDAIRKAEAEVLLTRRPQRNKGNGNMRKTKVTSPSASS